MDIIKASLMAAVMGGGGANLGTKTITANGTYAASDDSLDGYSEVTVNVLSGIIAEIENFEVVVEGDVATKYHYRIYRGVLSSDVPLFARAYRVVAAYGSAHILFNRYGYRNGLYIAVYRKSDNKLMCIQAINHAEQDTPSAVTTALYVDHDAGSSYTYTSSEETFSMSNKSGTLSYTNKWATGYAILEFAYQCQQVKNIIIMHK